MSSAAKQTDVPGARAWHRRMARYERDRAHAIAERNTAIIRATRDHSIQDIADAFDLTRQFVYRIVAEGRNGE